MSDCVFHDIIITGVSVVAKGGRKDDRNIKKDTGGIFGGRAAGRLRLRGERSHNGDGYRGRNRKGGKGDGERLRRKRVCRRDLIAAGRRVENGEQRRLALCGGAADIF